MIVGRREDILIRKKIKSFVRQGLIKVFNMDFDVEDRRSVQQGEPPPSKIPQVVDPSVIPKVVSGSGDTPGPNHKEDIGRTWCSAQVVGGVAPFFIDIRPPNEVVAGMLPNSLLMTGQRILEYTELLPSPDIRIVIYDQTGDLGSADIAHQLREKGWTKARRLQGGFVEWIEFGEDIVMPSSVGNYTLGGVYRHESKDFFIHRVIQNDQKKVVSIEIWSEKEGFVVVDVSKSNHL